MNLETLASDYQFPTVRPIPAIFSGDHKASLALWHWIIPFQDHLSFDLMKAAYNVPADKEKDRLRFQLVHEWLLKQLSFAQDVANHLDTSFGSTWEQVCKGEELAAQEAAAYAEYLGESLLQYCAINAQHAFCNFLDVKNDRPWAFNCVRGLPSLAYRAAVAGLLVHQRLDARVDLDAFCQRLISL